MGKTMAQRGYGREHLKLRAQWAPIVASGAVPCTRCGLLIAPGAFWDLDHTDDRAGYAGCAHRSCNRAAGARKGNRMRRSRRYVSESW